MSRNAKNLGKLLTLTLVTSVACYADLIGPFSISGDLMISAAEIDFSAIVRVTSNTPSDDSNPTVDSRVNIGNLNEAIGVPINVPNWLTTTTPGAGDVVMTLTMLPIGGFTPTPIGTPPCGITGGAVGDTCTPIVPNNPDFTSNFSLMNLTTGYSASFDVMGTALDLDTNTGQNFTGTFTAMGSGGTYQSALATIATGGTVTVPFSANFTFSSLSTGEVPEPSYLPIVGGLAGLGLFIALRRKTRTV